MAQQIKKKFIGNDQVDGDKILLENGQAIVIKDSLGVEQELIKLGASDEVLVKGQEVSLKSSLDAEIAARIAADSAEESARIAADALKVNKAGDTMTGTLIINPASGNSAEFKDLIIGEPWGPDYAVITLKESSNQEIYVQSADKTGAAQSKQAVLASGATESANSGAVQVLSGFVTTSGTSGSATVSSGDSLGSGNSGFVQLKSGQANNGNSGSVEVFSSNASGNSGIVILQTGTAGGTRGHVQINGAHVHVNNTQIRGLANGSAADHAINKGQLDALDSDLQGQIDAITGGGSGSLTAVQSELDATQVGAGLEPDGSFLADPGAAYTSGSSSLFGAISDLDSALNGIEGLVTDLQDDTAAIKTGAGLNVDGSYIVPSPSNYLSSASSLADADNKLDTQIKAVADDVAALETYVDATFVPLSQKGAANGVATLGSDGKIPSSQVPSIAITDVYVVADIAARDALTVEEGDVAKVSDAGAGLPKTFIFDGSIWIEIESGSDVDSVFGRTGAVVAAFGDYSASLVSYGAGSNVGAKLDSLQSEIDAEEVARAAADSALQGEIDAEEIARAAADTTLQNNIDAEESARIAADNALDARLDTLEAVVWIKEKFAISNGQTSVTLSFTPKANSMSAFVDRLAIHEGAAEDFTISGTTMTFLNDLVSPGQSQLGSGDTVYVKYQK